MVQDVMETFPALEALSGVVRHAFVRRVPGIDVSTDKAETLEFLTPWHRAAVEALGFDPDALWTAQQVHGGDVAVVDSNATSRWIPKVDGLATNVAGEILGIHVADCGAVYIVDPVRRAVSLSHSGKRGTELGIAPRAISLMEEQYGSRPKDLIVQLGPCIRPPHYEVDFAAQIRRDCAAAGVPARQIHDSGTCTHSDPDRYYSYRRDKGRTGRLLALLGLLPALS